MSKPIHPKKIIAHTMKTELDLRIERLREYLLMREKLGPIAEREFDALMARLTNRDKDAQA